MTLCVYVQVHTLMIFEIVRKSWVACGGSHTTYVKFMFSSRTPQYHRDIMIEN